MMKKVLIVSYHFPPDAAVGAIRPAKFAKYLRDFGWEPRILSVAERRIRFRDPTRVNGISGIPVLRPPEWPTLLGLSLSLKRRLSSAFWAPSSVPLPVNGNGSRNGSIGGRLMPALKRHLNSIFELPDRHIGWLPPAVWAGQKLVREEGIRIVLSSSPPNTAALVGLCIAGLANAKLVTDLRDPWFLPEFKQPDSRSPASDAIERRLERAIAARSDLLITTTDQYREYLLGLYPELPAGKFRTIPNGYDAEDFRGLEDRCANGKFTLSYLGTFYLGRTPGQFLEALGDLVREGVIRREEVEVNFAGDVRRIDGRLLEDLVRERGLDGCVNIGDHVPYRRSLEMMKESHVLLLFAPDQYHCIPAKAYEYIGTGRRILCLAGDGATAELIRRTGAGMVVGPQDVQGIKAALRKLHAAYRSGELEAPACDATRFERKNLSGELAAMMDELLDSAEARVES